MATLPNGPDPANLSGMWQNAGTGISNASANVGGQTGQMLQNPLNVGTGGPLGTLTGTAGGAGGTGFNRATGANITAPTNGQQVDAANVGVGNSLASQNALIAALQGQGGIGNQASLFNNSMGMQEVLTNLGGTIQQGNAMGQQNALNAQLGGAGGVGAQVGALGNLGNLYGQQQGLANQLQGIAQGRGPNPAQAMLNQQTGQNVANQAALMAGQRGAGSNVGLMARQAAQQGAATQQQAVGQGATMQAQQSLGALGQIGGQQQAMGQTAGNIANIGGALTGQQQAGIGQQFGQGVTNVGQVQAQQGIGAGIAQNQVGNLLGAQTTGLQGNITNAGQQMGALNTFGGNQVNMQGNINSANTSLANTGMQGQQAMLGGALNGLGGVLSSLAQGGEVRRYADGGDTSADIPYAAPSGQGPLLQDAPSPGMAGTGAGGVGPLANAAPAPAPMGPQSALGQYLMGQTSTGQYMGSQPIQGVSQAPVQNSASGDVQAPPGMGYGSSMLYKGASSTGSGIGHAASQAVGFASMMAKGGASHDYRSGGPVAAKKPEEKAKRAGNSYSNDKIPALLSEHEIVIPREITMGKDPINGSAAFVRKVLAKKRAS